MQSGLDKSDLIRFESTLKNSLAELVNFSSYSLYFPQEIPPGMKKGREIAAILEKDRLLLPLSLKDNFLGIFLAKGTDQKKVTPLKPYLNTFTSGILEKLIFQKQCETDSLTGLYNHEYFCSLVEKEIEAVLSSITPGPGATMDNGPGSYSACFCVMIFNLDRFRRINQTYGFVFGDQILKKLGREIAQIIPEQAVSARLVNDTFAIFWPQPSQKKCINLAESIREKISDLVFEYDVSGEKITITASGGSSFFPHDIKGAHFRKSPYELARIITHKATQSMELAKENGRNRTYSFGRLLSRGGVVMENLPLGRMVINLGKNVDAAEGQKFMVWSGKFNGHSEVYRHNDKDSLGHYPPIHKGEITILEVQDRISIAEILYLNDPSWHIEPGDKLTLLQDRDSLLEKEMISGQDTPQKDILTGLYAYRDFMAMWNRSRDKASSFCMAMLKIHDLCSSDADQGIEGEKLVQEITSTLKSSFSQEVLGGRYSSTCLIFFFPELSAEQAREVFISMSSRLREQHGITIHAGICPFPYLNYSKIDTLDNCRKTLEHAALSEFPHVAVFNSLTLTISADRLFTQGDSFAALEEYKLALAADESNILARNSLAVCYARLGRMELARKHFQEITEIEDQNLMAWYNLACVCLKQSEAAEAQKFFEKCLSISPDHAFSLYRMGQLAENSGNLNQAEEFYVKAGTTEDGKTLTPRHLARVAWKRGNREEARELLHQALINNPRDAFSLNLMSRVYLESGDDPQIAESLARQSVILRPDVPSFWLDLSETLKAQGKDEQAARAKARAYG